MAEGHDVPIAVPVTASGGNDGGDASVAGSSSSLPHTSDAGSSPPAGAANHPGPAETNDVIPSEVVDYLASNGQNGSSRLTDESLPSDDPEQLPLPAASFTPSASSKESTQAAAVPVVAFPSNESTEGESESDELGELPITSKSWSSPPSTSDHATSPTSPSSPHVDSPLLASLVSPTPPRSASFVSSPLNPNAQPTLRSQLTGTRGSRSRIMSEESAAFGATQRRGSMLLYRLASDDDKEGLTVPVLSNRFSSASRTESTKSFDDKYPSEKPRGLVPYVYDPELANEGPEDEVDRLHAIEDIPGSSITVRGLANVGILILLIIAFLFLFVFYPTYDAIINSARLLAQDQNININGTGQNAALALLPSMVDKDTPEDAFTRTGFDGKDYTIVFSDEFNKDGRTFYPGDDPYWEAVDLWYGATSDLEWYDPSNAFTRDGHLVLLLENVVNHDLNYRSGMIQSWNKFCFTSGYIEVSVSLPGPNDDTEGYWPGAWTMGNLGRPGYEASTDGMWPYSYDSCDVGTFPNQTYANGSGPTAATNSDAGWAQYNYELSWLSGQRASACTCKGEDHPGPKNSKGRGAPEIDILEMQKNQVTNVGGKVSQSVQFAPFTHDYDYATDSTSEFEIFNEDITQPNGYKGSPVQQAVSGLTDLKPDIFNGTGGSFYTFGFEYWSDPSSPEDGYIIWQANGVQSLKVTAGAVGPDPLPDGTGVGQRLIAEEPMAIILNLGMSKGFQDVDLDTMTFPAEFHVDYVRVYQRDGEKNVGCDPKDYPTADYISRHADVYSNPNLTTWTGAGYTRPKNSLYDGC